MYLLLSHLLAFSVLLINSLFDVFSEKGDVPDLPAWIGIGGGLLLHAAYSFQVSSWTPMIWMAVTGLVFAAYGWFAYFQGMWGGADAMGLTVVGFAAPYAMSGPGIMFPLNFLVNMMIIGLLYTIAFAASKAYSSEGFMGRVRGRISGDRLKIVLEIIGASALAGYVSYMGMNPYTYFASLLLVIFLYPFLKVLEDTEMTKTVAVEDLEGGEVVADQGDVIEGITEEEIDDLDTDEVEVKEGIRFMPVFPVALLLTDMIGAGVPLLLHLF
ncbi:MAG: hypothetical protein ABEJ87_01185 [Candidatus Nanohalobium sp.]